MESHSKWVAFMDPRESYASPTSVLSPPLITSPFCSWFRKERALVRICPFNRLSHLTLILSISSAVIEDIKCMREAGSALMAYYYFDFKDIAKRNIRGLLSSLLGQLSHDCDRCWDVLSRLHSTCRDGKDQPSVDALAECLEQMLEVPRNIPIYIILDALDECPNITDTPSARDLVLNLVANLVKSQHPNVYICITSRPEPDIRDVLDPLAPISRRVSLHEEEGQRDDIVRYIRYFVCATKEMRRWRTEDQELVINTLADRAGGMYGIPLSVSYHDR
jgi:hypothetical protein